MISAIVIALSILGAAYLCTKNSVKPRIAFAQVSVLGTTEQSEQVHLTATLFDDESPAEWQVKLNKLYGIREDRLKFQNERMIEIHEKVKKEREVALQNNESEINKA